MTKMLYIINLEVDSRVYNFCGNYFQEMCIIEFELYLCTIINHQSCFGAAHTTGSPKLNKYFLST